MSDLFHIIDQIDAKSRYDRAVKKLLANKIVLAHILKGCVQEYRGCTIEEIISCIEGEPEIGSRGMYPDDTNRKFTESIAGSSTEDVTLTEGTRVYDIRFRAVAPGEVGKTDLIHLIINIEAQNVFYPGYPLVKRGIYYGSRLISAQYGPIFTKEEYGKIRKVYSIWVCSNPSVKHRNTITEYSIRPNPIVGNAVEEKRNYDLMSIVMIGLGNLGENDEGLLKFLKVLLSSSLSTQKKKRILHDEFDVAATEEFEKEMNNMCNLSQGIEDRALEIGRQEGRQEGRIGLLVELISKGRLTEEQAAEDAGMTPEEFREAAGRLK